MICFIVAPALPMISPAVVFGTIILTLKLNLVSNISTLTIVNRSGCPWDVSKRKIFQIFLKNLVLFKLLFGTLGTGIKMQSRIVPIGLILIFLDLSAMEFGCSRTHLSEHISKI